MSSSVARITGPGTVPLYVQAGKKTPGAISISLVERAHLVLAHAPRLVRESRGWIQERVEVVRPADRRRGAADHRRMPHRRMVVHMSVERPLRRLRVAVEGHLGEHGCCDEWSGSCEQASARKFRHD